MASISVLMASTLMGLLVAVAAPANLLAEEVCLPAALLKKTALENNIAWMQRYADARGVSLAPHGKTTMTPWIFQAQQRAGAWGIGVGSAWQASAAMPRPDQRDDRKDGYGFSSPAGQHASRPVRNAAE